MEIELSFPFVLKIRTKKSKDKMRRKKHEIKNPKRKDKRGKNDFSYCV